MQEQRAEGFGATLAEARHVCASRTKGHMKAGFMPRLSRNTETHDMLYDPPPQTHRLSRSHYKTNTSF